MIKILDDTKTLSQLVADTSNGLGHLDPLRCTVTEELNGIYEAELEVLHNDRHFSDLHVGGILKMPVNDTDYDQLFRIYYISKEISQTCVVKCEHISYDLSKIPVEPFSATGCSLSCNGLIGHSIITNPFSMSTDITNTTSVFTLSQPRSFRECLGGYEGSMLDTFRGEYKWDNLTVNYLARRGADNGVRISYGKNLTDFEQETNNAEVYTGVLGFATVDDTCYVGNVYNKTTGNKIKIVDFSSDYESGQTPTTNELTTKAQTYATNNDIEVPTVNIKISFVPLYQTEEYKNIAPLERVSLGDTVHVYFEKLGVEASSRVVKTVWNVLLNKYDSVELGSTKANLNTVINDSIQEATEGLLDDIDVDTSAVEAEMNTLTRLIVNGMGLYITKDSIGRIYLHNEPTLDNSQYQYMITAQGFVMSDDYGQNWRSGWGTDGHAYFNALSSIVIKAMQIYGSYIQGSQIVFGDPTVQNEKYISAQPYYDSNDNCLGVSFDGTGTIRLQPQEYFYVNNQDANGNYYNRIIMNKLGSTYGSNYLELVNYDDENGNITANFIELDAHMYNSTTDEDYNRTVIQNYSTASGTQNRGNYQSWTAYADRNIFYTYNYKPNQAVSGGTSYVANYLQFTANSTTDAMYLYNYCIGGNYQSNMLELSSTSIQNQFGLRNNRLDGNYTANMIYGRSLSSTHYLELTNVKPSSTVLNPSDIDYANRIYMSGGASSTYMSIINYRPDQSTLAANRIVMNGSPTGGGGQNSIYISNYDPDGANIANEILMYKTTSGNTFEMRLNRGGTRVACVGLYRTSSGVTLDLNIYDNNSYGYTASQIHLNSDGEINLVGSKVKFNGTQKW